jgi:hypothetical protein
MKPEVNHRRIVAASRRFLLDVASLLVEGAVADDPETVAVVVAALTPPDLERRLRNALDGTDTSPNKKPVVPRKQKARRERASANNFNY